MELSTTVTENVDYMIDNSLLAYFTTTSVTSSVQANSMYILHAKINSSISNCTLTATLVFWGCLLQCHLPPQ